MQSFMALITVMGEGGRPDNSLPGGSGGQPSHPIYHPGHPDHGLPAHPDQGLPGSQPHPDQGLPGRQPHPGNRPPGSASGGPRPDQGLPPGEPIEINPPLPDPPSQYEDKVIVAIKKPDEPWKATAYDAETFPDNELPATPAPKR